MKLRMGEDYSPILVVAEWFLRQATLDPLVLPVVQNLSPFFVHKTRTEMQTYRIVRPDWKSSRNNTGSAVSFWFLSKVSLRNLAASVFPSEIQFIEKSTEIIWSIWNVNDIIPYHPICIVKRNACNSFPANFQWPGNSVAAFLKDCLILTRC